MKKIYTFLLPALFLLPSPAWSQPQGNQSAAVFHWRCAASEVLLNNNPVATSPLAFDSIPYAKDYTVVVVYKPVADTEAVVWRLLFPDDASRALTTEHIVTDTSRIRYAEHTSGRPLISTLRQSAPDSLAPYVQLVVNPDSLLRVAELLYFDHRLGSAALRRLQSELAIRYGITLGPVDYIDAAGTPVWTYRNNRDFHHRIAGIAHDTLYGLHQLRSRSEEPGGILTLAADSLRQGEYLLCGDNDGTLAFEYDGATELLNRQWKLQGRNMEERLFSLAFDIRSVPPPADSLVLFVCDEPYLPSALSAAVARFDGLWLPSDSCLVRLARNPLLWQLSTFNFQFSTPNSQFPIPNSQFSIPNSQLSIFNSQFSIYPNPTTGHFSLEVRDAEWVQATVYNMQGAVEATFSDSGRGRYLFSGTLPPGNAYFVTVVTESHTRTMKITVK